VTGKARRAGRRKEAAARAAHLLVNVDLVRLARVGDEALDALLERRGVREHAKADAVARRLARVARPNALLGGADLAALPRAAAALLEQPVDALVEVKEQVRAVADGEAAVPADAARLQVLQLGKEAVQVHDGAVAQQVHRVRVDDAAGQQVEGELLVAHDHRVARVGAAVEARHDIVAGAQSER
jgi:hypothetical protein